MPTLKDQTKHQDEIIKLEISSKKEAAKKLKAAIAVLGRTAAASWIDAFGSLDAVADDKAALTALVATLQAHLGKAPTDVAPLITKAVKAAQSLGATQAARQISPKMKTPKLKIEKDTAKQIAEVSPKVKEKLALAAKLLGVLDEGSEFADVQNAVLVALQGVTAIEAATTYLVNQGAASGVKLAADQADVGTVFVGERDACLKCVPNIGKTDKQGYDDPPVHPNCRCSLAPWSDKWATAGEVSFPESLQREAERSVLKGWSLPTESNAARLRAADALLKAGTDLPKSVKQAATKAVKSGQFKSRVVPASTK